MDTGFKDISSWGCFILRMFYPEDIWSWGLLDPKTRFFRFLGSLILGFRMMVSWHNWKLKLKWYWFSVWCWWSKWKDASWSQCDFPGRSTEDPGRSKSGVAAPQDIPTSYTCSKCNFTTQKAEDTPTTSSSGVPDARAKPVWGIILHFLKSYFFGVVYMCGFCYLFDFV